jgi:hypothetical protein
VDRIRSADVQSVTQSTKNMDTSISVGFQVGFLASLLDLCGPLVFITTPGEHSPSVKGWAVWASANKTSSCEDLDLCVSPRSFADSGS